ncbi:MAG: PAS domain-containing protein [Proteobacteria bacterium]|nr:PAS domain-containing protein [Pseudomonadota bacterium]
MPLEKAVFDTGQNFFQQLHPDDRPRFLALLDDLKLGADSYQTEYRWLRDDGKELTFAESARAFFDGEGNLIRVVGATTNITERRQVEELVRKNEKLARQRAEELEKLMESAPIAIFISRDPECREIVGNRLANQIYETGHNQNVSAGSTLGEQLDATRRFYRGGRELSPSELPMQTAAREGREIRDDKIDVVLPSQKTICMLGSASPLFDSENRVRGSVGAFTDITRHRAAEAELLDSQQRLNLALAVSNTYAFEWEPSTDLVKRTASFGLVMGIPVEDAGFDTGQSYFQRIHPEDRPCFLSIL